MLASSLAFLATVETNEPDPSLLEEREVGGSFEMSFEPTFEPTFELLVPFPLVPAGRPFGTVPLGGPPVFDFMLREEDSVTGSFGFFSGGGLSFSGSELEEEVAESSGEALRFLCGGK